MLIVLSDTHGTDEMRLTPHLREQLARAECVIHAGDFTTEAVLDEYEEFDRFVGVAGNSDTVAVCERLPERQTVEWEGRRFVVTHGHRHDWTTLSLLGRQEKADVVVVGHTHRPAVNRSSRMVVVNPGSHADPRGECGTYARFERTDAGVRGQVRTVSGATTLESVML